MLLTGTFFRALDEKQRLAIPRSLRESAAEPGQQVFYLAPGTDESLGLYSEQAFCQLADQLDQSSPNDQDVRAFNRLFFAQAQRVDLDRQGRLRVPAQLAQLAGLEGEVVLLGVKDHIEVWDRRRWETYLERQQPRYSDFAVRAFQRTTRRPGSEIREGEAGAEAAGNRPLQPR
jgi:MraZ protein